MLRPLLLSFAYLILISTLASGQGVCPTAVVSDKLICVIPQAYGVDSFTVRNPAAVGQFQSNFLSVGLSSLESSVPRQSSLLPVASPASGVTFAWDAAAKAFTPSTDSFGPILGERADTVGKSRVFLGFAYQYFNFDKLDSVNLKDFHVVLPQADDSTTFANDNPPVTCSLNGTDTSQNFLDCGYIRDVITTDNRVDLKIHQFTTFITYGVTNRLDFSVAIPIVKIVSK